MNPFAKQPSSATPIPSRWVRDSQLAALPAITIWALLALLVAPPDFSYENARQGVQFQVSSGGKTGPLIILSALAISATILIWRWWLTLELSNWINRYLLLFVALATLSMLWSIDPAATLRRLVRLYIIVMSCIAFVLVGWHAHRFQNVLRPAITLICAGSIVLGITAPDYGIESGTSSELIGAWKGLTMQKNSLGALSAVGLILWIHAWLSRTAKMTHVWIGGAITGICVILSRSSTSLLSSVMSAVFLLLMLRTRPALRPYMPYIVGTFAAVILVYSLAVLDLIPGLSIILTPITTITGKDLSFSGRTMLWEIMVETIKRHPFLGVGLGAYWTGPTPGTMSYEYVIRTYIYPTHAHNGYLDVINELGALGGLCLLGFIVTFLRQSLQILKIDRSQAALYFVLLFQAFLANLSESHWFQVASFNFLIITLATASIGRHLLQDRLNTRHQAAVAASAGRG